MLGGIILQNTKSKEKIQYIERLRSLAIVLVILIHVVALPIQTWKGDIGYEFSLYTLSYTIGCLGVPIFLMISGNLLLNPCRKIKIEKVYKKMIPKILFPLLGLGTVFACMEIYFETRSISFGMLFEAFVRVINGKSWNHLWYLYMIIGIYMFTPILKFLSEELSEKMYIYFTIILLCLGYVVPSLNAIFRTSISVNAPLPLCHMASFWLGFVVDKYKENKKINVCMDFIGIISLIVIIFWGIFSQRYGQEAYLIIANYDNIFVIGAATYIYRFVQKNFNYNNSKLITSVAECSFGIYLLHPVVMNILYKVIKISPVQLNPWYSILLFVLALLVPTWAIVWILKKIPWIREYI